MKTFTKGKSGHKPKPGTVKTPNLNSSQQVKASAKAVMEPQPAKTALFNQLQASFVAMPVEDGMRHQAENTLEDALSQRPQNEALNWLIEFSTDADRPTFASSVLRCLACLEPPGTSEWRASLIKEALDQDQIEIREAAIQAIEHWEEPSLVDVLQEHQEEDEWLRQYGEKVIRSQR